MFGGEVMIEEELVNRALIPYEKGDKEVLIGNIKAAMNELLGILRGIDKDSFQITKNAFIILHNILTANTKDEVVEFAQQFNSQSLSATAQKLYFLRLESEWSFRVIAIAQHVFYERGMWLVEEHRERVHNKVLLFRASHGNEKTEESVALEKEEQNATLTRRKVSEFFLKYSV